MRAVWIASVVNIDWPAQPGQSVAAQQQTYRDMLDLAVKTGLNTVIVQIRPTSDALYPSATEPWSRYLTGEEGLPPTPYYNVLQFLVEEAHDRALEFHAWINPYRASMTTDTTVLSEGHPYWRNPDWFVPYGPKLYYNPGIPAARKYVVGVIADVARHYDVDAIHFDDYFYPYKKVGEEFADSATFATYPNGFDSTQLEDWRRENINLLIKETHDTLRSIKPWLKFGVSPFGVWRNKADDPRGSDTRAGQPCYDFLYADLLHWMEQGWLDYLTPQLYWRMGHPAADFTTLTEWWNSLGYDRHMYIGQGVYRVGSQDEGPWTDPNHLVDQLELVRSMPNLGGVMLFSMNGLQKNPLGITDILAKGAFAQPALPPLAPWLDADPPEAPGQLQVELDDDEVDFTWSPAADGVYYAVYAARGDEDYRLVHKTGYFPKELEWEAEIARGETLRVKVTALDRLHNESEPNTAYQVKRKRLWGWDISPVSP